MFYLDSIGVVFGLDSASMFGFMLSSIRVLFVVYLGSSWVRFGVLLGFYLAPIWVLIWVRFGFCVCFVCGSSWFLLGLC